MECRYAVILPGDGYPDTPRANILDSRSRRTSGHRQPDFRGTLSRQQATDRNGALMGARGEDAVPDRWRGRGDQNHNDRRRTTTAALRASGTDRQRPPSDTVRDEV